MCVRGIDFVSVFTIGFWNCVNSVVFLELCQQCGIFRIVSTVWYFLFIIYCCLIVLCHVEFFWNFRSI